MLGKEKCLELIEAALAACECDQAEVVIYATDHALTRFADSTIHQNVAERNAMLSVRAVRGRRSGAARGNQLTVEAARDVSQRAKELAAVSAEDREFVSLAQPQPIPDVPSYAEATAASTPETRAAAVQEIVAVARREACRASGSLSAETAEMAIGNSLGVRAYAPATQASLVLVAAEDESSGYAEWHGLDLAQLDPRAAAEVAVRKCVLGRGAQSLPPDVYPVLLEPPAVADMLSMLAWMSFGANAYQEGRSFMSGRMGQRVAGENVSIWDDGTDPRGLAFPFDWEGMPKRKVMLIDRGVAAGIAYDTYSATKEGKQTTGNALPQPNTYGALPMHLFLGTGDASEDDMIASTEYGLLVTRFHYTNVIHEKKTTFTGMTRDGTFLIQHGRITGPVQNLRFTQSILEALNDVEMIGERGQLTENGYAPAVKVRRFSFTS